jgi:hypothetical protein
MISTIISIAFLGMGNGCGTLPPKPQLQKEILQLGCKQDVGLVILYQEGEFLFPAQMPPGCRCFILIDGREYVTTVGVSSKRCEETQ